MESDAELFFFSSQGEVGFRSVLRLDMRSLDFHDFPPVEVRHKFGNFLVFGPGEPDKKTGFLCFFAFSPLSP